MNYIFLKRVERPSNSIGLPKLANYNSYNSEMYASGADENSEDTKKAYDIALTVYTLTETDFLFVKRIHVLQEVEGLIEKIKASDVSKTWHEFAK